jgi:hypothetical protein
MRKNSWRPITEKELPLFSKEYIDDAEKTMIAPRMLSARVDHIKIL